MSACIAIILSVVLLCLTACPAQAAVPRLRHSQRASAAYPLSAIPTSSPRHPSRGALANAQLDPATDCAFRSVAIEVVTARQPADARSNWTELAESAFQMHLCSNHTALPRPASRAQSSIKPPAAQCARELFVDGTRGDDGNVGSASSPLQTVEAALTASRQLRLSEPGLSSVLLCITLRAGRYHLGGVSSSAHPLSSSRIGAVHLSAADSNLVLQGAESDEEEAVLSGGVELGQLNWTMWKTCSEAPGQTIMRATLPAELNINAEYFNELYVDGQAAVRAKFPNGNPYNHGLYSSPRGYLDAADSWLSPRSFPSPTQIHTSDPHRAGSYFQNFDLGVGGGASVFDPPSNLWSTNQPLAGDMYRVPGGMVVGADLHGRAQNWTNVERGLVHAFHGWYWAAWIFQMASVNQSTGTVLFGRGGFQEARGLGIGGNYYVSNLLEELDEPNEWYYEPSSRTLYFMANQSTGFPTTFVASQRACLVSIVGSSSQPASNITLRNLRFTETRNTFLSSYEAPPSGDWAVHRGGSVYVEGAANISIDSSLFTYVATNGLVVSDWNQNISITHNEFVWMGDSAVILLGSSSGLDGVTNRNQPDLVSISHNLMHETGAYVKQSAPTFIALSRRVDFTNNVLFNVPRSGININDGFAGNKTIAWNVMFNTVRETADHGPINSWDRLPYLTEQRNGASNASLTPHDSYIHHNALFNTYSSYYPIDHDDGSCYYIDTYNVQFYGVGHSKTDMYELYIYPDTRDAQGVGVCIADQSPVPGQSGWDEVWTHNRCLLYSSPVAYNIWSCDVHNLFTPLLANNTIYAPVGAGLNVTFECARNGSDAQLSLAEWQSYGEDFGTQVLPAPEVSQIVQWVRDLLIL